LRSGGINGISIRLKGAFIKLSEKWLDYILILIKFEEFPIN
jgi:hypothetical protein